MTVLGAAGGIGQPLSLLLKLNPRVTELALYDIRMAPGKHRLPFRDLVPCDDATQLLAQLDAPGVWQAAAQ